MPSIFSPQLEIGWMPHLDMGGSPLIAGSISLVSKTDTVINLSATDATGGTGSYTYQWKIGNSPLAEGAGSDVGTNSLTLNATGLTPDTVYYFRLRYTDSASTVVYSAQYSTATNVEGGGSTIAAIVVGAFGMGIDTAEFD